MLRRIWLLDSLLPTCAFTFPFSPTKGLPTPTITFFETTFPTVFFPSTILSFTDSGTCRGGGGGFGICFGTKKTGVAKE